MFFCHDDAITTTSSLAKILAPARSVYIHIFNYTYCM